MLESSLQTGFPVVLVTGVTGYIGSHVALELARAGLSVVGVDNFQNSQRAVLDELRKLSPAEIGFVELDVRDQQALGSVFEQHNVVSVVHLAGSKAVGESTVDPLGYYDNNVGGAIALLAVMAEHRVRSLVFSSSCTVYGNAPQREMPLTELSLVRPTNPYGRTKLHVEEILKDLVATNEGWNIAVLRYFNPAGADESGRLGEDPKGTPHNLMPYVMQVAVGLRERVGIHGDDYDTPDGTCIRDYIHVSDLARGHVDALRSLGSQAPYEVYNLSTGVGSSVLDVVRCAEMATGTPIAVEVRPRRPGDAVVAYGDPAKANGVLGWKAERDLMQMCADHWRWQQINPDGYQGDTAEARIAEV